MNKPTLASAHKRFQPIFNHYVRLRDTWIEDGTRVGRCISCQTLRGYHELQAGHFVPERSSYYLRYNEDNVNAQCQQCNGFRRGNWMGYMLGLADKMGQWEVFELVKSRTNHRKYTVELLAEAEVFYRAKIGEFE